MMTNTASNPTVESTPAPRKQESLPGIGIPEVEDAARALRDHRTLRMRMQDDEAELSEKLLGVMDQHNLGTFRFEEDGVKFIARIKSKRKVSVVQEKNDADSEDA